MATNNFSDNTIHSRGVGIWTFIVYAPDNHSCGPYAGNLDVGKDFHTVSIKLENGDTKYIVSIPSQNVSFVEDNRYIYKPPVSQG